MVLNHRKEKEAKGSHRGPKKELSVSKFVTFGVNLKLIKLIKTNVLFNLHIYIYISKLLGNSIIILMIEKS